MNKILLRIFDFSQTTVLIGRDVQIMGSMNYFKQINKINLSNRISATKIKYWTPTN